MPLVSPFGRVTCPFCFGRFHLSRAPHRQIGPKAATEPDHLLGGFFSIPPPTMGKVIDPPSGLSLWQRLVRRFLVPPEGREERKVCPHCHIYLPDKIANGEIGSEVFAIVGARSSGKSNYFGVLINSLRRRFRKEVGFDILDVETFTPAGPVSTADLYRERYGRLFDPDKPQAVGQTESVTTAVGRRNDPRIPLIYLLRFRKRPWQYLTRPLARRIPVYLMIFDAAGEDMVDQTAMAQYYRFLDRATGIIFLIDPFEYPGIRNQLPPTVRSKLPGVNADPALVVNRVISHFQGRGRRLRADRRIPVPAAFAFTKSDMFREIDGTVYRGSALLKDSSHDGGYDREGGDNLSREVMQCVAEWDSPELVAQAQENFSTFCFFALSALGASPDPKTLHLRQAITPLRVADPLMWLLWRRGYMPAVRRAVHP